jgi:hypothetical protein
VTHGPVLVSGISRLAGFDVSATTTMTGTGPKRPASRRATNAPVSPPALAEVISTAAVADPIPAVLTGRSP